MRYPIVKVGGMPVVEQQTALQNIAPYQRLCYFSFGGEVSPGRLSPILRRAWAILTPVEAPNDGMVSLASARWGEFVDTIHADHFAQTPDAVFLRAGEDFDTLRLYCGMVENLARRGF